MLRIRSWVARRRSPILLDGDLNLDAPPKRYAERRRSACSDKLACFSVAAVRAAGRRKMEVDLPTNDPHEVLIQFKLPVLLLLLLVDRT